MRKSGFLVFISLRMLCAAPPPCDDPPCNPPQTQNVNSRYTVASLEVRRRGQDKDLRLSTPLQDDLKKLLGQRFDQQAIDSLRERLRRELHALHVSVEVHRGDQPESVSVLLEVSGYRLDADTRVTRFGYQSKEGFTGGLEIAPRFGGTQLAFGIESDADTLLERYAGISARFSQNVDSRLQTRLLYQGFHEQWNQSTLDALASQSAVPGIYRSRRNFEPTVAINLADGLTLIAGFSFETFQMQFPAVRTESANAVVNTLRFRRSWGNSDTPIQDVEAGYTLRAATSLLGSDFGYVRHNWYATYEWRHGHSDASLRLIAGLMNGKAPLYERFALGNGSTLRGWSKYELDPLGGNRMAHGSASYSYRWAGVFLDTGAVWDTQQSANVKQSAGIIVNLGSLHEGLALQAGFPLRSGHVEPLFLASLNF